MNTQDGALYTHYILNCNMECFQYQSQLGLYVVSSTLGLIQSRITQLNLIGIMVEHGRLIIGCRPVGLGLAMPWQLKKKHILNLFDTLED